MHSLLNVFEEVFYKVGQMHVHFHLPVHRKYHNLANVHRFNESLKTQASIKCFLEACSMSLLH